MFILKSINCIFTLFGYFVIEVIIFFTSEKYLIGMSSMEISISLILVVCISVFGSLCIPTYVDYSVEFSIIVPVSL